MTRRYRKLLMLLVATALMVAGVVLVFVWKASTNGLPQPGSKPYQEVVAAFYAGVAAMDTDAEPRLAKTPLLLVTKLAPGEPAAWANLALLELRQPKPDVPEVIRKLEIARSLSPQNGKIEQFFGLLAIHQGRFDDAIARYRTAVERDPGDLKARYALYKLVKDHGEEGEKAEAVRQLTVILDSEPKNLEVLLMRADLAATIGDRDTLRDSIARLAKVREGWPETAVAAFQTLEKSAAGDDLRLAAIRTKIVRNNLNSLAFFQRDLGQIQPPLGRTGEPIEHFLRMAQPLPTPSAPDLSTTFASSKLGGQDATKWGTLVAIAQPKEGVPRIFLGDANQVRAVDGNGAALPFPGGAANVVPSAHGVLAADWNFDFAIDFVFAGAGGLRFFAQEKEGTFTDATSRTGLAPEILNLDLHGVWAIDFDLDGDLDFAVAPRTGPPFVVRNNGKGSFGISRPFEGVAEVRDFAWFDLDREGTPDIVFLDKGGNLHVFANERAGRYRGRAAPKDASHVVALTSADLNNDGLPDLVFQRADGTILRASDKDGQAWDVVEVASWPDRKPGEARLFVEDLDNNGSLDLIASGHEESRIWLGDESNRLRILPAKLDSGVSVVVDLNNDGRLDVAGLDSAGAAFQALGGGKKSYHWQVLRPRAGKDHGDGRINSFGLGGVIEIRAGLLVETQVITDPVVHFGLGDHPAADVARIVWPNGTVNSAFGMPADREILTVQDLHGSCPFVYAFNGEKIEFVTDFLWRSPLGLRINAQDTAGSSQTEDWVKIRGDQLVAREGSYDIRLTGELWETHYWDHVSLMVVDHPIGTDVFVDERFARVPPALMVHAMSTPRPVPLARDDEGRDVTADVSARDGEYLDNFGRGFYQGVTRDHWVEVEIPDNLPSDRKLWLVANGWIHPTNSSINVAIGQGSLARPQGLVLEVATAEGGWAVARDDLGFPAGKNKTILVDLDGVLRPGAPRRVRLRTNLEIFWDALAVASGEPAASLKTQRVAPSMADLRFRGYSLIDRANDSSPELPHYETLTGTGQKWRDLIGFYTRFGDVRELLEKVDDRYVIVNAGDEVAFRFPAPAAPEPGLTRDFVLIGDGWNKDGDFNTAFSKTVLPLPSHDWPAYDVPPGALEDDPIYKRFPRDWEDYHTRYITPQGFRDALRPGDRR